ncbi:MAG TPA: VTT domain-containing protein [Acidobacteriaceae bacterium]|nr:VTT domain-containing protein [Acidobacteriaceae bacterium]
MKHKLLLLLIHWKIVLLSVMKPLGFWGVAALAAIDSSSLAIPMDIIVAGYVWADRKHFWLYAIMVGLGSAVGSLVPFFLGRAGGELFLLRRIDRTKYEQLRTRFERQGFFAVMIPAALPPPTPFKLFAFGAGVFEMRVLPYMAAVFFGRTLHYLVLGILTVRFGPEIVDLILHQARRHTFAILLALGILLAVLLIAIVRKQVRSKREAA